MTPRHSETLYILGPMTALKGTHREAAAQLLAAGYNVIDPTAEPGVGWQNWFKFALSCLPDVDGVVLLPGTTRGRGGKLLTEIAFELGLPIHTAAAWLERAAREKVPW